MPVEINPAYQTHIQTYLDRATAAHAEALDQVAVRSAQRPERNEEPALPPDPAP
jgi:hypothetical protein